MENDFIDDPITNHNLSRFRQRQQTGRLLSEYLINGITQAQVNQSSQTEDVMSSIQARPNKRVRLAHRFLFPVRVSYRFLKRIWKWLLLHRTVRYCEPSPTFSSRSLRRGTFEEDFHDNWR